MDIVLRSISCDKRLPVSVVEETFAISCNGKTRCYFHHDTIADMTCQCKSTRAKVASSESHSSLSHSFVYEYSGPEWI